MKKREIVLIIALVVFGLIYQAIEKGRVRFAKDFSFYTHERQLKGSRFSEFPAKELLFPGVSRVVIENPAGEVSVGRSADGQVHLASILRIYYSDKGSLDELRRRTEVKNDLVDGVLKISASYPEEFPYQRLRILFHLQVPPNVALSVSNHEGDVVIRDTGKDLQVAQENGYLVMENIPARSRLLLKNCVAKIKGLADHAEIMATHSNVTLADAVSLRLNGRHGEASIQGVKNDVVVEYAYGRLQVNGAGKLEITAQHSDISAKNIQRGAVVDNRFETTLLEDVSGDIRLSSRSGRIVLRRATAGKVVIENSFADVVLADFSATTLDVLLKNGNLDLSVKNVTERINVEAEHAELDLVFAALADPTFNIKTRNGRIEAQPLLGLENFEENEESFANRSGGRPEILIHDTYGTVRVKVAD
jgi:hypothetical protein